MSSTTSTARPAPAEPLRYALGRQVRPLGLWGSSLVCYALLVVLVWPTVRDSRAMDDFVRAMPEGLSDAFGVTSLTNPAGYLSAQLYALILPLVMVAAGIGGMVGLTAADEDAGLLEMVLVLPVSRRSVFVQRAAAVAGYLVALAVLTGAALLVSMPLTDLDIAVDRLLAGTVAVLMLALLHAAVAFVAAGWGARAGTAGGVAWTVALTGYAVDAVLPSVHALRPVARISPWHWALGADPLRTGFDGRGLALLAAGTLVLALIGLAGVDRRDVRAA